MEARKTACGPSLRCAPPWRETSDHAHDGPKECRRLNAHSQLPIHLHCPMSEKIFVVMGVERGSMPHPTPRHRSHGGSSPPLVTARHYREGRQGALKISVHPGRNLISRSSA